MAVAEATDKDHDSESESRCQICLRVFVKCLKRFVAFLFSHVGLTCLVAGYAILGGILFKAVELPEEKRIRQIAVDAKATYVEKITELFDDSDIQRILDKSTVNKHVDDLLKKYQDEIYVLTDERDWDGRFEGDAYQWSFAESLLYSVTVISTIGYGNITPKTIGGRLLTIVYGIGGIPLTMLCLHNIGNLMAGCFRLIYRHACINMTYQYIKLKRRRIKKRFIKRFQGKTKHLREWAKRKHSHMSSMLRHSHSDMNNIEEDHENNENNMINTLSTASDQLQNETTDFCNKNVSECRRNFNRRYSDGVLNDSTDAIKERKYSLTSYHQYGTLQVDHAVASHKLSLIPEDETVEVSIDDIERPRLQRSKSEIASLTTSTLSLTDFEEDERLLKTKLKDTRDLVPISVCLLIVTGYIMLGALIFASWEETWNFMIAFYFCFITLTTIGFGDFVPGMGRLDNDEKRVFGALYLLFGMALLAMSFHLIQEEVRHKCKKIAVKIGLVEHKLTELLDKYDEAHS